MQTSYRLAPALAVVALLSVAFSFAVGQSPTPANFAGVRYAVQFSVAKTIPLYFITDNATETLHIYENGPKGCQLKQSIDLSQVGQVELTATASERVSDETEHVARETSVMRTKQR